MNTDWDPLDPLTHHLSAKRARDIEAYAYELYAEKDDFATTDRLSKAHWTCYYAEVLDRRERNGLVAYEKVMFDDLLQWLDDNISGLDPSMMHLHGGQFSMAVSAGEPADPVYLLERQYNTGPFWDGIR